MIEQDFETPFVGNPDSINSVGTQITLGMQRMFLGIEAYWGVVNKLHGTVEVIPGGRYAAQTRMGEYLLQGPIEPFLVAERSFRYDLVSLKKGDAYRSTDNQKKIHGVNDGYNP